MKHLIKKFLTKETILYIIFGFLTTIVNIGLSTTLLNFFNVEGNIASTIGIVTSIVFAYFTNRKIVFSSKAVGIKENFNEFLKFSLGRAFTMVLEIVGVFVLYSVMQVNYLISKLIITVIVIIGNFCISKFFAFKK